ncbi:MAG: tRNA (adenosine(37)-N6)-threonylcarbamoyltransferase complex transferase subunit TsaD [Bacteroidia bacterium]|jgi:N6-L-threonylcarbamoyladenine synthase|nr:tRNA (adenosine(37)-N6)-threonylcarbamoyltransferase complex transferase subunit TsaD [Bacteroidia bacterium]
MGAVHLLAIESSCDDTAAAVMIDGQIKSNIVAGQNVHELYGGVVPELASRAHQQHIVPVVDRALKEAGINAQQLNAIATTAGPGLIGSLMVGVSFAKSFAMALGIPVIEVNHMQAHILAHFIDEPKPAFPFICLTVSGGHTLITVMHDYFKSEVIGQTIDDAAGEAFDKAAKLLNLPYPGGPLVDKYAQSGNPKAFAFPKPTIPELDYSFSGIKTSILYFLEKQQRQDSAFIERELVHICASIQHTIVAHLMDKLTKAVEQTGIQRVALAGGVSANSALRAALHENGKQRGWEVFVPDFAYCTDNAAMIAQAGLLKWQAGMVAQPDLAPYARN